jgi:predicted DNA binding CopG/RHH family protein
MVFDGEASRILILHRDQYSKRAAKIHVPVSTLLQALLDTRVPIWRGHHGKLTTVQEESPPWHDRSGRLAARPGAGNYRPHGQTEGEGETMKATKAKAIVLDTPEFRSEAEETESWDRLKDLIADLLVKHGRRGAVPTKNISVRLPVSDIERARALAAKRGVGYQTLIKTLLHDALKRESRIA